MNTTELLEGLARLQQLINETGLGPKRVDPGIAGKVDPLNKFDQLITNPLLHSKSRHFFISGHYSRAVEEAFKCINEQIKTKANLRTRDGDSLAREVFSPKNPILKLQNLNGLNLTPQSEDNLQSGYMEIYTGSWKGIRGPRAHESFEDDPDSSLEMLVLANHLMKMLGNSKKTRKKNQSKNT